MTTNTSSLPVQIFAFAQRPAYIVAHEHHVRRMTRLAARLHIPFRKERPEPMLVRTVRFLGTRRRPAVSLMARRTAKLFWVMRFQKFRLVMTCKRSRVLVRLLAF